MTKVAKLVKIAMASTAVVGIAKVSAELINAASDAEEVGNKFNVVFRDISDDAEAAAENLADNFGLSGTAAKELLGNTGDLLTGFGLTQEAALDLSEQTNQLAVDLASFTNAEGGAEAVSAALTSAYTGERDSLKSYGIVITEAMVQAQELKEAKEGLIFASDAEAQSHATLTLALEQSKNAIGDFERSSDSYANQLRVAQAAVDDLKVVMGEGLLPIATESISIFAGLTTKLTEFIQERQRLKELDKTSIDDLTDVNDKLYKYQQQLDSAKLYLSNLNDERLYSDGLSRSEMDTLDDEIAAQEAYIETLNKRMTALSESAEMAAGYAAMRGEYIKSEAELEADLEEQRIEREAARAEREAAAAEAAEESFNRYLEIMTKRQAAEKLEDMTREGIADREKRRLEEEAEAEEAKLKKQEEIAAAEEALVALKYQTYTDFFW